MRQLETEPLFSYGKTDIDTPQQFIVIGKNGENLSYNEVISQTPAITSSYDGLNSPQMSLRGESDLAIWDETARFAVGRLNPNHVRNLEILSPEVMVKDGFGNAYTSICIKGSNFSNPHIFESLTAARKHIIYGLQESLVIERVIRASRILRESGVLAEYICGLVVPKSFPITDAEKGFDEAKNVPFTEFYEKLATKYAIEAEDERSPIDRKREMLETFADCEYVITYRAMDIPYRLNEIQDEAIFNKVKSYIKNKSLDVAVDIETCTLDEFLSDVVVVNLANSVDKMHKKKLVHGFLHGGNISALGSLLDLDSCRGEALDIGDKEVTQEEIYHELLYVCASLISVTDVHEPSEDYYRDRGRHARRFMCNIMRNKFGNNDVTIKRFLIDMLQYKLLHPNDSNIHFNHVDAGMGLAGKLVIDTIKDLGILTENADAYNESDGLWDETKQRMLNSPISLIPNVVRERHKGWANWTRDNEVEDMNCLTVDTWIQNAIRIGRNAFMSYVITNYPLDYTIETFRHMYGDIIEYTVLEERSVRAEEVPILLGELLVGDAGQVYKERIDKTSSQFDRFLHDRDVIGLMHVSDNKSLPVLYKDYENLESHIADLDIAAKTAIIFLSWDKLEGIVKNSHKNILALAETDVLDTEYEIVPYESSLWNFTHRLEGDRPKLFLELNKSGRGQLYALAEETTQGFMPKNGMHCSFKQFMMIYEKTKKQHIGAELEFLP